MNKAGRETLITSNLNNIPTYWFQLFRAPKLVTKQLEWIRRDFFCKKIDESGCTGKKLHSIGWNKIILPKELGGLGLTDLNLNNIALMSKWWWKLSQERSCMWHKIVIGKYDKDIIVDWRPVSSNSKIYSPIRLSLMHFS